MIGSALSKVILEKEPRLQLSHTFPLPYTGDDAFAIGLPAGIVSGLAVNAWAIFERDGKIRIIGRQKEAEFGRMLKDAMADVMKRDGRFDNLPRDRFLQEASREAAKIMNSADFSKYGYASDIVKIMQRATQLCCTRELLRDINKQMEKTGGRNIVSLDYGNRKMPINNAAKDWAIDRTLIVINKDTYKVQSKVPFTVIAQHSAIVQHIFFETDK